LNTITDKSVVEIAFTLSNSDGEILDRSEENSPLAFIQGQNSLVPALESKMLGKELGSSFDIIIDSEDAYGPKKQELIQVVPKDQFGSEASELRVGMQFEVQLDQNESLVATIVEVKESEVVLDANHPLAGHALHFKIQVLSIREATKEELKKGLKTAKASSCSCC
jgi:FKBP-type peptidyl-prolyl cis-trans isomerase SlyD